MGTELVSTQGGWVSAWLFCREEGDLPILPYRSPSGQGGAWCSPSFCPPGPSCPSSALQIPDGERVDFDVSESSRRAAPTSLKTSGPRPQPRHAWGGHGGEGALSDTLGSAPVGPTTPRLRCCPAGAVASECRPHRQDIHRKRMKDLNELQTLIERISRTARGGGAGLPQRQDSGCRPPGRWEGSSRSPRAPAHLLSSLPTPQEAGPRSASRPHPPHPGAQLRPSDGGQMPQEPRRFPRAWILSPPTL